jgi:hypothetical protein
LELKPIVGTRFFSAAATAELLRAHTLVETLKKFVEVRPASFRVAYRVTSLPLSADLTHFASGTLQRCRSQVAVKRLSDVEGYDPYGPDANSTLFRLWTSDAGERMLTVFGPSEREARRRHREAADGLVAIKRDGFKSPLELDPLRQMVDSQEFRGLTLWEQDAWIGAIFARAKFERDSRRYFGWTPRLEELRRFGDSAAFARSSQDERDREIKSIIARHAR